MKAAIFFDRDGVLVEDVPYLHRPEEVVLISEVAEIMKMAQGRQHPLFVVTNQSGIGRGLYGFTDYEKTREHIHGLFRQLGVVIDDELCAPHAPTENLPFELPHPWPERRHWRKPGAGMLLELAERHAINLSQSVLIGNSATDIEAAEGAGLKKAFYFEPRPSSPPPNVHLLSYKAVTRADLKNVFQEWFLNTNQEGS